VALGGLQSLLRAPEAKMILIAPVILVVLFGSLLLTHRAQVPEPVLPLMAYGSMALVLMTLMGLIGNAFGVDRDGFRIFVLCPASRREILLGKNLAFAPLALGIALALVGVLEVLYPMRFDHLLGLMPHLLSMYLLYCTLANWLSILAPMRIAPGSYKPTNPKFVPVMLQMLFAFLFPLALAPTLLPLGLECLADWLWFPGLPIYLVLSVAVFVGVVYLYRLVLTWQGTVLQAREQKILDLVTTKAE
jgi:hypothetical protein